MRGGHYHHGGNGVVTNSDLMTSHYGPHIGSLPWSDPWIPGVRYPRSMDLESSDGLGPFPRGPNSRLIPYVMTPLLGWTEPHIPNTVYHVQGVTT